MLRTSAALVTLALATTFPLLACDAGEPGDSGDGTAERSAQAGAVEETVDHAAAHAAKIMSRLDADGSGSITSSEAEGSPLQPRFALADLDADGEVDGDELAEFASQMAEMHGGAGHGCGGHGEECAAHGDGEGCGGHGAGHECGGHAAIADGEGGGCGGDCEGGCPHGGGPAGEDPAAHVAKMIGKFDLDGDGAISRAEVGEHRLGRHFDMIDADANGTISREELVAHAELRMSEGHRGMGHHDHARGAAVHGASAGE